MNNNKVTSLLSCAIIACMVISSCKKDSVFVEKKVPETVIGGLRLSADTISLVKDTIYIISENITRNANQVLVIQAGTLIKVMNNIAITINVGGKIIANGSQNDPIVFTSSALKGTAGINFSNTSPSNFWSGIKITGSAGSSSGIMKYVRIEFSQTLLFKNVDKSTEVSNIQASYTTEAPAYEFNGGNCEASNLVSYASYGSDFVITGGFTGKLQNLLAYRHPYFPREIYHTQITSGLQISGSNTFPSISNVSVVGPDMQVGTSLRYQDTMSGSFGKKVAALIITNMAKFKIRNSVLSGFPKGGFYLDSRESAISLQQGESEFTYSAVHSNDSSRAFYIPTGLVTIPGAPPITADVFQGFMLQPSFNNQLIRNTAEFQLTDPYNFDINPNPQPMSASPLLNGANFSGNIFSDPFFKPVTYRGAIGVDNWLQGWTNFIPLQTDYSN